MPPPISDRSIAQKASNGIMKTAAISRGMTSASTGETPMVRIASISSVSFIVPSCAANAEPERPGHHDRGHQQVPSSRTVIRPMRLIV